MNNKMERFKKIMEATCVFCSKRIKGKELKWMDDENLIGFFCELVQCNVEEFKCRSSVRFPVCPDCNEFTPRLQNAYRLQQKYRKEVKKALTSIQHKVSRSQVRHPRRCKLTSHPYPFNEDCQLLRDKISRLDIDNDPNCIVSPSTNGKYDVEESDGVSEAGVQTCWQIDADDGKTHQTGNEEGERFEGMMKAEGDACDGLTPDCPVAINDQLSQTPVQSCWNACFEQNTAFGSDESEFLSFEQMEPYVDQVLSPMLGNTQLNQTVTPQTVWESGLDHNIPLDEYSESETAEPNEDLDIDLKDIFPFSQESESLDLFGTSFDGICDTRDGNSLMDDGCGVEGEKLEDMVQDASQVLVHDEQESFETLMIPNAPDTAVMPREQTHIAVLEPSKGKGPRESKWQCGGYNNVYKYRGGLHQYVRIKRERFRYRCDFCSGIEFTRVIKLILHYSKVNTLGCNSFLHRKFVTQFMVEAHLRAHRIDGWRNLSCNKCEARFKGKVALEYHSRRMHSGSKNTLSSNQDQLEMETVDK